MVDKCRKWLEDYLPNEFDKLCAGNEETAESEKKHQKRGGKVNLFFLTCNNWEFSIFS